MPKNTPAWLAVAFTRVFIPAGLHAPDLHMRDRSLATHRDEANVRALASGIRAAPASTDSKACLHKPCSMALLTALGMATLVSSSADSPWRHLMQPVMHATTAMSGWLEYKGDLACGAWASPVDAAGKDSANRSEDFAHRPVQQHPQPDWVSTVQVQLATSPGIRCYTVAACSTFDPRLRKLITGLCACTLLETVCLHNAAAAAGAIELYGVMHRGPGEASAVAGTILRAYLPRMQA